MLRINSLEKYQGYVKRSAMIYVRRGFKRFAKKHYDECEVVFDEFKNCFRLLYNGHYIPCKFARRSELDVVEEEAFRANYMKSDSDE